MYNKAMAVVGWLSSAAQLVRQKDEKMDRSEEVTELEGGTPIQNASPCQTCGGINVHLRTLLCFECYDDVVRRTGRI